MFDVWCAIFDVSMNSAANSMKSRYDVVILGAGHPPSPSRLRVKPRRALGFGVASNGLSLHTESF
jgi:hypothetical protein